MSIAKPSAAIALCGTDQPDVVGRILRAGPVSVELDQGQLRYLRINGIEALRALAFLVRDENWGTYVPVLNNLKVEQRNDGFSVSYSAVCSRGPQRLDFDVQIEGSADGRVEFRGTARPKTDFLTARTGFVILHPLTNTVGKPVTLEHVDGGVEQSSFPEHVNPVQPFLQLRAMTHEVLPGVKMTVRMHGDTWETEDHRNWTDASFKTYVRPLALPWPYILKAGQTIEQSVVVSMSGKPTAKSRASSATGVTVKLGKTSMARLPTVGLGLPAEELEPSLAQIDLIKRAGVELLIGQFDPRKKHGLRELRNYRSVIQQSGARLMLEVIVAGIDDFAAELARLADLVSQAELKLDAIAVVPVGDLKSVLPGGQRPPAPDLADLYRAARAAFPGVPLGGGMFSFFTELNRKRVPARLLDFVTNTTCPTVHAADDRSVMETLEALPHQIRTARGFIGNTSHRIGPSAIGCRDNPHGASYTPNPDNQRVCLPLIDPRMRGLYGAAWVAGYIATLARCNVMSITIGATTGPLGVIYRKDQHRQPFYDGLGKPAVFPAFHVISGIAPAAGASLVDAESSDPAKLQTLAYRQSAGTILWLINLTAQPQQVELKGLGRGRRAIGVLDQASFVRATTDPIGFQADQRAFADTSVRLDPYAVAFIGIDD